MHLGRFKPLEVVSAYGVGVVLACLAHAANSLTPSMAARAFDSFPLLLRSHFWKTVVLRRGGVRFRSVAGGYLEEVTSKPVALVSITDAME